MTGGAPRLLLATRSEGKRREIHALFAAEGIELVDLNTVGIAPSPHEDLLETAETFEENALAKARWFHRLAGLPAVADDSGLMVDALGGAPGVRSKRWSQRDDLTGQALDDENNRLLLARLKGVTQRSARYVCAAAYCHADVELVERGESLGVITTTPRGTGGFGYDPYFESAELAGAPTFAEVSVDQKSRVSHRGRAFAKLLRHLRSRR